MERFSPISSGRKNIVLAAMFGLGPILIIGILPINYDSPRKRCASDWVNREIAVAVILTANLGSMAEIIDNPQIQQAIGKIMAMLLGYITPATEVFPSPSERHIPHGDLFREGRGSYWGSGKRVLLNSSLT
jgi:hypothetical protein